MLCLYYLDDELVFGGYNGVALFSIKVEISKLAIGYLTGGVLFFSIGITLAF